MGQDQYIYDEEDNEFMQDDVKEPIGSGFLDEEFGMMLIAMDVDEYVESDNAEIEADTYDKYIGAEVCLTNTADEKLIAKVRRKIVSNNVNDSRSYNSILDSLTYEVQFSNGTTDELAGNVIAECILS